jgi:hypothetical protein
LVLVKEAIGGCFHPFDSFRINISDLFIGFFSLIMVPGNNFAKFLGFPFLGYNCTVQLRSSPLLLWLRQDDKAAMGNISHMGNRRLGSISRKGKPAEIKGGTEHTCTVRQVAQLSSAIKI